MTPNSDAERISEFLAGKVEAEVEHLMRQYDIPEDVVGRMVRIYWLDNYAMRTECKVKDLSFSSEGSLTLGLDSTHFEHVLVGHPNTWWKARRRMSEEMLRKYEDDELSREEVCKLNPHVILRILPAP